MHKGGFEEIALCERDVLSVFDNGSLLMYHAWLQSLLMSRLRSSEIRGY